MKALITKIRNNTFLKNVLLVSSGTALAQALALFTTPLITRLYTPDDFGVYSLLFSIIGILASISTLRYEVVIPIAKSDKIAQYVIELGILVLILFITILALTIFSFGGFLLTFFGIESLREFLWVIPIVCLLIGMYNLFSYWAIRKKDFKILTKTKFAQSITGSAFKIFAGFAGFGGYGLIIGGTSEKSAGIISLFKSVRKNKIRLFNNFNYKKLLVVGRKYKDFPLYQTGSQFLLSFGPRLPLFFIAALFGVKFLGLFALASSIISAPINLIGSSVSHVYFAEIAQYGKNNNRKIYELTIGVIKKLTLLSLPALFVILLFGPDLFEYIFGENWRDAGNISRFLIFIVSAKFIVSPVMHILNVLEWQYLQLRINIIRIILITVSFACAYLFNISSNYSILLYSMVLASFYLITFLVIMFKLIKMRLN
ncbi:O-antigen/teichoic acid export membrane protein [Christiangramia gaetbulicola]|uniref:O-antigen/teichoic acid export membrane protein n=1 Tax=Christiangramia gaetbulicola TaxID=703340 RepID=A0A2T6AKZ4_9FLAO|nr:oligosaccharide flippase family protein [Christiangramia gaetbulicola]PTX44488.1 O-antigen/teichoic acid export membrane protein [Christiangramia gaetbulicola]